MMRFSPTLLAAAASVVVCSGCLTSTQATRLQGDLDEVKRQLFQVQQETSGTRSRVEAIDQRLGAAPASSSVQADLMAAIQALQDQLQALSDQMREFQASMAGLSGQIRSVREAPPGTGAATGAAESHTSPPALPTMPRSQGGAAADQQFTTAYADYSKGNYELAMMTFSEFLRANPDHPLAPDAQYWIGECLYSQGRFPDAVEAFDRTLSEFPLSAKVPAALLKKGYAQMESGQTPQAVTTLQTLIQAHPNAEESRLAAERLKRLGLRAP